MKEENRCHSGLSRLRCLWRTERRHENRCEFLASLRRASNFSPFTIPPSRSNSSQKTVSSASSRTMPSLAMNSALDRARQGPIVCTDGGTRTENLSSPKFWLPPWRAELDAGAKYEAQIAWSAPSGLDCSPRASFSCSRAPGVCDECHSNSKISYFCILTSAF